MSGAPRVIDLPPVIPCAGCGAGCIYATATGELEGECYGQVRVVDRDDPGTDNETELHGCEGHQNGSVGPYVPFTLHA